jgi:hypothetical protein
VRVVKPDTALAQCRWCQIRPPTQLALGCPKIWPARCAGAGQLRTGDLPGRELVSDHCIPVYRATVLLCQLAAIAVSTGWMAGIRGRAAAQVEASGCMDRVRELSRSSLLPTGWSGGVHRCAARASSTALAGLPR